MPLARGDLIGAISRPGGPGGPTGPFPEVEIYFTACAESTMRQTNFQQTQPSDRGSTLTVYAHFVWTYDSTPPAMGEEPTKISVQNFTNGDIQAVAENDAEVEDRIDLGHVNRASALAGELISVIPDAVPESDPNSMDTRAARYYMPITMPANSAGRVYVTVQSNSAGTIPRITMDTAPAYGPENPVTAVFSYSTLFRSERALGGPQAYVIVPIEPIYAEPTAQIVILWDTEMEALEEDPTISSASDADIALEGATYVDDSFTQVATGRLANLKRMAFMVTLTPTSGTCTVTVKADKFTSVEGIKGPDTDTLESFLYDTNLATSTAGITVPAGTPTVIYDSQDVNFSETSNPIIGTGKRGAFKGVSDLTLVGDEATTSYFYGTIQIQDISQVPRSNPATYQLVQGSSASAALFKMQNTPRNAGDHTNVNIIKRYNTDNDMSIVDSARSITEVGSQVYFFEGSHPRPGAGHVWRIPASRNAEITSDTNTRDLDRGVAWRSRLVNPNAETQEQNITYSQHRNLSSPMVTTNNNVYLNPGYGHQTNSIRLIKSTDWESSENQEGIDAEETRIDNWTLLKFGRSLDFRPAVIQSNGRTGYEIIRELAQMCFSYIGFDGNTFIVRPKYQPLATMVEPIAADKMFDLMDPDDHIKYQSPNSKIPSSGYCQIKNENNNNKEIFHYTGLGDNRLNGITRGQLGTDEELHCATARIEFFDHIIDANDAKYVVKPINLLNVRQDLRQLYNIIKIGYGDQYFDNEEISRNESSVMANRPRELEFTVPLDHHDSEWVSWLAEQYRDFYSEVRYLVDLQLQPSFYIKVGDFIMLRENQSSRINRQIFQVLKVNHEIKPYITNVQLRSVTPPNQ